jgi:hypothetical protein
MWRTATVLLAAASMSACTWIELTPEGEKVRVLSASEVTKCVRKGKTDASVLSKVGGIERLPHEVEEDLILVARNTAPEIGGDTIVPITPVKDGKQTFAVYRCVPE